MRLLQLTEAAATGAGRHVIDLTEGLLDRGHEVHLLYSDLRYDQMFASNLKRLAGRSGLFVEKIPIQRKPSIEDVGVIRRLRQYLRHFGPFDLVHCHSTKAGLVGRAGLIGYPVKTIYTSHGFFTTDPTKQRFVRRAVAAMEATLANFCNAMIVVSEAERAHAIEMGIDPRMLYLIPNGVAGALSPNQGRTRADLRRAWEIGEEDIAIGFVGRFTAVKSADTLLHAFAALPDRTRRKARLVMVGDGPLQTTLRELATAKGIDRQIAWVGGSYDARQLMGGFDIFALTSQAEGHPLALLEAMAQGLPIVATRVGGVAETIEDGVSGFITPILGVNEIAARLDELCAKPALRKEMGHAAHARSSAFTASVMVERTLALYSHVASGIRRPATFDEWERQGTQLLARRETSL